MRTTLRQNCDVVEAVAIFKAAAVFLLDPAGDEEAMKVFGALPKPDAYVGDDDTDPAAWRRYLADTARAVAKLLDESINPPGRRPT